MKKQIGYSNVQRINFIEGEPFVVTYGKMVMVGVLLIASSLMIFAVQWTRARQMEGKVMLLSSELARLQEEQKARADAEGSGKMAEEEHDLLAVFESAYDWSVLLDEMIRLLPTALWLTGVKSYEKKENVSAGKGLTLSGQAEEPSSISLFLRSLSRSRWFKNVVLISSKQETSGSGTVYRFEIDAVPEKEGQAL